MVERQNKVPWRTKIAFSAGAMEEAVIYAASTITMVYYNQVLGVSAYLCGIVFLIAGIVDAVTDPLVGSLSDNFRSRWGRRHPFMVLGAVPLILGFYLLYAPPDGMSETFYFGWFLATLTLLRLGKTFFVIPHNALGAELTDNYHERTLIFGLNSVATQVGAALVGAFVLIVFFPSSGDENGLLTNPDGWSMMAVVGAGSMLIALVYCIVGTADQIPHLHNVGTQRVRLRDNLGDLAMLLKSRSYVSVCAAWLVMTSSGGILAIVSTYTYIYGFGLSTAELSIRSFVTLPGMFLAIPFAAYLTKRLDKKMTMVYACIFCGFMVGLPHTLAWLGLFPANDSVWMLPSLYACLFIGYLTLPMVPIVYDSQLTDIADEHEYRTGRRAEGVIFAFRTFAIKSTVGIGGLIGGFGLELIDFPENATKEMITPEMLNGLYFMNGPLYWLIVATGMLFMGLYNLNEKRHGEMMKELHARREAAQANLSPGGHEHRV